VRPARALAAAASLADGGIEEEVEPAPGSSRGERPPHDRRDADCAHPPGL